MHKDKTSKYIIKILKIKKKKVQPNSLSALWLPVWRRGGLREAHGCIIDSLF